LSCTRLEADIDQDLIAFDGDDAALDDGSFQAVAGAERLLEQCGEAFAEAFVLATLCQ
jgi:hypothetical protein